MLIVDIVLLVILLGFVGAGMKDGFVYTIGRILGAVLGFAAAQAWSGKIVPVLDIFMPNLWARFFSFLIIFILATRLVGWIFKLVDGAFHILSILPFMKSINHILGAVLGLVEGFIIMGGAIYIILAYNLESHLVAWLNASWIAHWIGGVFGEILGILL